MSSLFERYKSNADWLVVEGLPDTEAVRTLLLCVSLRAEAYNIQPRLSLSEANSEKSVSQREHDSQRLGDSVLDVAFKNLKRPDK